MEAFDYNAYHKLSKFSSSNFGKTSYQGDKVFSHYGNTISSVLDFGCGNGYAVHRMNKDHKLKTYGYEVSETARKQYQDDSDIWIKDLNSCKKKIDIIYSTEVFEHIPENNLDEVIENLTNICKVGFFMTISLRPSSDNNAYHCTLKPRHWWEAKFEKHGLITDRNAILKYQINNGRTTTDILSKWSHLGPDVKKFAENPPYELNGEEQFWFFIFKKLS